MNSLKLDNCKCVANGGYISPGSQQYYYVKQPKLAQKTGLVVKRALKFEYIQFSQVIEEA